MLMDVKDAASQLSDALHRSLKARGRPFGMSLADYLLAEIKETSELRDRLHKPQTTVVGLEEPTAAAS